MNYKREELDYIAAQLIPVVLEKLGVEAQGVSEVEIVTDLTGVYSLPAYKKVDGTEKVVEAPVSLLQDIALDSVNEATENAKAATGETLQAAKETKEATADYTAVRGQVIAAGDRANAAADSVNDAKDKAKEAAAAANQAAAGANAAKDKATEAADTANAVKEATLLVKDEAAAAARKADTSAVSADTATLAANRAATNANTEAQNLSALKRETQNAASSAGAAAQTAGEKIVELDALMKAFSGESAAAPVILEVSAPATISTRNRVPQRIDARLLPGYVVQNLLYLKDEGDSLKVNPSGKLTVAGTGTTTFFVIPTQNTELWQEVKITVRTPLIRLTGDGKIRLNGGKIRIV